MARPGRLMFATIGIMVVAGVVAIALAAIDRRRRAPAPMTARGEPPTALDRRDFRAPDARWLIAVFSSATCSSCAAVIRELRSHESPDVAVTDVEVGAEPRLHSKYGIESVPTAVIADRTGDAKLAFVGPLGPDHRNALATLLTRP